jgi:predicted DsbA family dithiol-disulfide isomerase
MRKTIVIEMALALVTAVSGGAWSMNDGNQPVATIGNHQISKSELDARVLESMPKNQLYNLRMQALDQLINRAVIESAASKAALSPDEYLKMKLKETPVSEADAKTYYDEHKSDIDAKTHNASFNQIKRALITALQNRYNREQFEALIGKLRNEDDVKIVLKLPRTQVATAGHPWSGGKNARVTLVEFSDFQCPYCRAAEPTMKELRDKYGDEVKFVYMDFPLSMHAHALEAANAAQCAADQDKFWQYHDALFANQRKLAPADLKATAAKLGLDSKRFNACFDSQKHLSEIRAEQAEGATAGVSATPTFFVNGREIEGAASLSSFQKTIDQEREASDHSMKAAASLDQGNGR